MLGAERSFVFSHEARYRLPELALLAGNFLSYVAASVPAVAPGLREVRREDHVVRATDSAELLCHELTKFRAERAHRRDIADCGRVLFPDDNERHRRLPLDIVRLADYSGLGHGSMLDKHALHLH